MNTTTQQPGTPGKLKSFLIDNPWYGFAGIIVGIAGILLSIYFYFAGQQNPDLSYSIEAVRTVLVQGGRPSDLSVLYKNAPIEGSVTSVSIELWNNGKKAVTAADVLAPLEISLVEGHRILEAKIVAMSREITGLQLVEEALTKGTVGVRFKILEHNDAALIQLIYQGDAAVPIALRGIVVGQPELSHASDLQNQSITDREAKRRLLWFAAICLCVIIGSLVLLLSTRRFRFNEYLIPPLFVVGVISVLSLALATFALVWRMVTVTPPFLFK
jgi:hypothetical protein